MPNFYCEYCGHKFASIAQLTDINIKCYNHPNGRRKGQRKLYEGSEKNKYFCKYCGRDFASLERLVDINIKCYNHPNGRHKGQHAPAL